jgi:protein gp37
MAENTAIEWCDHTFNPWWGCQKVSPACDHCYAERDAKRFAPGRVLWGVGSERRTFEDKHWQAPLRWAKNDPARLGRRPRVFSASMADWLDLEAPISEFVRLLDLIRLTPELDWLLLSKRIGNCRKRLAEAHSWCASADDSAAFHEWTKAWLDGRPPTNAWLGATVIDQAEADRDIPKLLATPARLRFLSIEPILGPIDVSFAMPWRTTQDGLRDRSLDWVIVGGESGPGARPMHPDWARSLRDTCAAAGVPFLFKQWGEWLPISEQTGLFNSRLYRSNRVAKLHESQDALDELYGRTCTVSQCVIQADGTAVEFLAPMAFQQGKGSMQTFRVGKEAAGRQLDGRTHDEFPKG